MEKKQDKTTLAKTKNLIISDSNPPNIDNSCHICNTKFKDSHTLSDHWIMCNLYCQNCKQCVEGTYEDGNIFPTEAIHIWHNYEKVSRQM